MQRLARIAHELVPFFAPAPIFFFLFLSVIASFGKPMVKLGIRLDWVHIWSGKS